MFCPKCKSLLKPIDDNGKKRMGCDCGYTSKDGGKIVEEAKRDKNIEVVHQAFESNPLVDATCDKCGHTKAYFWEVQTRASDEPATKFYKCEKCEHTWRDYS